MRVHTWEDLEINPIWTQKQAKQDDWPRETWMKCLIQVIKITMGVILSESICLHVLFFLPNKHFRMLWTAAKKSFKRYICGACITEVVLWGNCLSSYLVEKFLLSLPGQVVCMCAKLLQAKLLQLYLTLCNPMALCQASLSMGILQARILTWVAMPSSRWSSRPKDWTHTSYVSCIVRQGLYH